MPGRGRPTATKVASTSDTSVAPCSDDAAARRWRVAGRTADLDAKTLALIKAVEPGPRSYEAEGQLRDDKRD